MSNLVVTTDGELIETTTETVTNEIPSIKELKDNSTRFFDGNGGIPHNVIVMPDLALHPNGTTYKKGINIWDGGSKDADGNDSDGGLIASHSDSYSVFNNDRFNKLCNEVGAKLGMEIEWFGDFNGGARQLCKFAPMTEKLTIAGYEVQTGITVGNSHSGQNSLFIKDQHVLHRCENQFVGGVKMFNIKHNTIFEYNLEQVRTAILIASEQRKKDFQRLSRYADVEITPQIWKDFESMMFLNDKELGECSTTVKNKFDRYNNSKTTEINSLGANDNGFVLWNAVTHYNTHNFYANDELNSAKETMPLFGNTTEKNNLKTMKFLDNLLVEHGIAKRARNKKDLIFA